MDVDGCGWRNKLQTVVTGCFGSNWVFQHSWDFSCFSPQALNKSWDTHHDFQKSWLSKFMKLSVVKQFLPYVIEKQLDKKENTCISLFQEYF